MNLIWDPKAQLKAEYLKFLSSICKFDNKGVS